MERSLNDAVNNKHYLPLAYASWKNREKRLLTSSCLSVLLSVRIKQLGSH